MGNDLRRQLGDAAGMSEFLQDLIKEEKTQRVEGRKPKRGNRRPKQQQRQTKAQKAQIEQALAVEEAVQKEIRHQEAKFQEMERKLKQENAVLRRLVATRKQSGDSIIPDDIDEFSRLFILAELIGKPPPGLS